MVETYREMTKFQPRHLPLLSVPSVVFIDDLLVALKRAGLLVIRWGCRLGDGQSYCRRSWREHHWQPHPCRPSQALGEVRYCLVDEFLWQLFPNGLQGDF